MSGIGDLHRVIDSASGRFICFTRFNDDTLIICATNGIDVWKMDLDPDELEAHRELANIHTDAYLAKIKSCFTNGDLSISQSGVKCTLTLGHGNKAITFDLYEAKAGDRKSEIQGFLFYLANKSTDLQCELEKSNKSLDTLKQQQALAGSRGNAMLGVGDKKGKGQPKGAPRQTGMSVINPGSRKRKAAKGVEFD